ncbi:MAG: hypothetical protein ACRELB_21310 [Polyangiaceae bacterium]
MRALPLAGLSLGLLAACGSGSPPPAASPPTAASSSVAVTPSAAAPIEPSACLPLELRDRPLQHRPVSPVEDVGTVVAQMKPDCSIEVHDAKGAVKESHPCAAHDDRQLIEMVLGSVCALGGEVSWLEAAATDARVEIHAGRYKQHDEAADLALLCAPFASLKNPDTGQPFPPDTLDALQREHVRAAIADETMTSPRWRRWVHELYKGGHRNEAPVAALRDAAQASHIQCEAEWLSTPAQPPAH